MYRYESTTKAVIDHSNHEDHAQKQKEKQETTKKDVDPPHHLVAAPNERIRCVPLFVGEGHPLPSSPPVVEAAHVQD